MDAVAVNRVLPDEITDPWFDRWRAAQATQLAEIDEGFDPVPVLRSALAPEEPVGVDALAAFALGVYGEGDPSAHHHHGPVIDISRDGERTVLTMPLPFTDRRDVSLVRRAGELIVSVGPYRRALLLPDSLSARKIVDASVRGGLLTVVFVGR